MAKRELRRSSSYRGSPGALNILVTQVSRQTAILSQVAALDKELDEELRNDERPITTKWSLISLKGQNFLYSRPVLLVIVILCVVDCLLVIGELVLDIQYMHSIVVELRQKDEIPCANRTGDTEHAGHDEHPEVEKVSHGFHYASIVILGILSAETSLKIIFFGKAFLKKKLEVFDAFIVYVSFIVDLVLVKGLTSMPLDEAAFILSFLLIWRVVRVVNSLLVAMMDHEHFKLILVYKAKCHIQKEMDETLADLFLTRKQVHIAKALCSNLGAEEHTINRHLCAVGRPSTVEIEDLSRFREQRVERKKLKTEMTNARKRETKRASAKREPILRNLKTNIQNRIHHRVVPRGWYDCEIDVVKEEEEENEKKNKVRNHYNGDVMILHNGPILVVRDALPEERDNLITNCNNN